MQNMQNITTNEKEYIWVEKYRPKTINDIILPDYLKNNINKWIKDREIPNLLLISKTPGLGKSSLAHVLISELQAEALFINASLESNIDTLRHKIQGFVSTVSFDGKPKIVVLDESDYLNPKSTQPALRSFIEEFSKSARFILTANYKEKIIEPVRDRLIEIDFDILFNEHKELVKDIFLRNKEILELENISYNKKDLTNIVKKYYPSLRKILMKLQQHSTNGNLNLHKESIDIDNIIEILINNILNKDFQLMRQNITNLLDSAIIYTELYENLDKFPIEKHPNIVLILAKYQANDSLVRDKIVNTAACLTEIMGMM